MLVSTSVHAGHALPKHARIVSIYATIPVHGRVAVEQVYGDGTVLVRALVGTIPLYHANGPAWARVSRACLSNISAIVSMDI